MEGFENYSTCECSRSLFVFDRQIKQANFERDEAKRELLEAKLLTVRMLGYMFILAPFALWQITDILLWVLGD